MNTYSIPFKQLDLRQLDNIAATPLERHLVERLLALTDPRALSDADTTEEVDNLVAAGEVVKAVKTHGTDRFKDGQREGADDQYATTREFVGDALTFAADNLADDLLLELEEIIPEALAADARRIAGKEIARHIERIRDALDYAKP